MFPERQRFTGAVSRWLGLILFAGLVSGCEGTYPQTTFRPVTDFGELINGLFANTFWWTMAILVVVEIAIIYVMIRYREKPDSPRPKQVHGNTLLEIAWTVVPAIIVAIIAVPTVSGIFATQAPAPDNAFVVEVVGHQWWWEFRYPELGIASANVMHVPVGRPVALEMRSADVVHSFWVPRIGGKRDVNPVPAGREGEPVRVNHLNFTVNEPGEYDGQCAEFCGLSHALMRMRVIAHSPRGLREWAASYQAAPQPEPGSLAAQGRDVFMRSTCIACHSVSGTNARGQVGPDLTNFGDRWTVGAGLMPNTAENVARWIHDPSGLKPGAKMPGTQEGAGGLPPTGLSDADVRAVAAYLTGLRADASRPAASDAAATVQSPPTDDVGSAAEPAPADTSRTEMRAGG